MQNVAFVNLNGALDINYCVFLHHERDFNLEHAPAVKPPSRASPLPDLIGLPLWNAVECGSGLARE
ncbi:hypothetical protein FW764_17230 [Pseudomonas sp. 1152_12]